jgi:hypothetical protein
MPLSTKFQAGLQADLTSPLDLGTPKSALNFVRTLELADGVGLNQADQIFHDQRTLAASGSENLDLAGALIDAFGNTLTFSAIKGMIFFAAAANTNNVQVGNSGVNGFINWVGDTTDLINIKPGGIFCLFDPTASGYPVTAGTGDLLNVANGGAGTSVTYDVVLIGIS